MKIAKTIFFSIYGIQVFLVLPWFLGAMYRSEQSVWVWVAYEKSLTTHGIGDARLTIYLYLLFYSTFVVIPFCILSAAYKPHPHYRGIMLILSLWFLATFLLLGDSIFTLLRSLPNLLLVIVWIAASFFIGVMWRHFHQEMRETKRKNET